MPQIGVLKAIGASNGVVGWAAVIQILIVTAMGVLIGGALTFLFSLFFPPNIPLVFNGQASALALLALLLIGPAGGMVSSHLCRKSNLSKHYGWHKDGMT